MQECADILDDNLLHSTLNLGLKWRFIFQQDNDPKHTVKITTEWLYFHTSLPEPTLETDWTSVEKSENGAWEVQQRRMGETAQKLVHQTQKNMDCNGCQKSFKKVLNKGCEYLKLFTYRYNTVIILFFCQGDFVSLTGYCLWNCVVGNTFNPFWKNITWQIMEQATCHEYFPDALYIAIVYCSTHTCRTFRLSQWWLFLLLLLEKLLH